MNKWPLHVQLRTHARTVPIRCCQRIILVFNYITERYSWDSMLNIISIMISNFYFLYTTYIRLMPDALFFLFWKWVVEFELNSYYVADPKSSLMATIDITSTLKQLKSSRVHARYSGIGWGILLAIVSRLLRVQFHRYAHLHNRAPTFNICKYARQHDVDDYTLLVHVR